MARQQESPFAVQFSDASGNGHSRTSRAQRHYPDISPAEARRRWAAFTEWAQSVDKRVLECRTQGHRFADWSDTKRSRTVKNGKTGEVVIHSPCLRKCGVWLTRFLDRDGFLLRTNKITHHYPDESHRDERFRYIMPKDARSGRGFTKAQRAYLRLELTERNADWITIADDEEEWAELSRQLPY
jgi:hypothetical protein